MANKRSAPGRSAKPAAGKPKGSAKGATPSSAPSKGKASTNKRVTPKGTASGRYTPPTPRTEKVSPLWVPVLMFTCLGLGMIMIILNYVSVLPKSPHNGWLLGGLGAITVGFITATKFH